MPVYCGRGTQKAQDVGGAPVLQEYGFDATFFVSELDFPVYGADNYADGVEKGVYMTWEEIAQLAEMG